MQPEPYDKLMDDYGTDIGNTAEEIMILLTKLKWDKHITLAEVENWLLTKIPKPTIGNNINEDDWRKER